MTRLVAIVAAGLAVFAALALAHTERRPLLPGDAAAARLAATLRTQTAQEVVAVLTDLGSLPVTALITALTAIAAVRAGRRRTGLALAAGLALTWATVHLAKAAEARPRPEDGFTRTFGLAYPSGHAAYAVAIVACALVLARIHDGPRGRALVAAAVMLALFVGASRIYLRVHYLSDVVGGLALAAAAFAACALVALAVGRLRHNGASP